ncbi:leucyl/phenylalanyl-tRNA--protein transferase [Patiriisocius sp. Uisw_017]|jgi:leucyl/phenylalanyl-tRNA--protein transferase|uniref:leucyl/phenylalanyl-tRNA--protein transferase n=1 Tax=Patiriisocius sp. Uisw_017 TaxID=3230968 RepID=UPI0039EA2F02
MYLLNHTLWFPNQKNANEDGILAIGGDLSIQRLQLAYESGIFPWFSEGEPIIWWSPDPRMVLFPSEFKVSKSLRRTIAKTTFKITFNEAFEEVITSCAEIRREGQGGTWITSEMKDAYVALHKKGIAQSVEVWEEDKIVGGIYGIKLEKQKVFCGESMFAKKSDASKIGLYFLVEQLKQANYKLIDCQVYTPHLEGLGAREIARDDFLYILNSKR